MQIQDTISSKFLTDNKLLIANKLTPREDDNTKMITSAEGVLRDNSNFENILELVNLPLDNEITSDVFVDLTIHRIYKANATMLNTFVKIRMDVNIFNKSVIAVTKGTPVQVHNRELDKKTKGHLLIEQTL